MDEEIERYYSKIIEIDLKLIEIQESLDVFKNHEEIGYLISLKNDTIRLRDFTLYSLRNRIKILRK